GATRGCTGWHETVSANEHRLEHEAWRVQEDAVVRDERDAEVDRRCRDPPIGVMAALGQRVSRAMTSDPKGDGRLEKLGARPHDLSAADVVAGPPEPVLTPRGAPEPELELGHGLERNHVPPASKKRLVQIDEWPRGADEVRAEHVRVDDNRRRAR